MTQRFAVQTTNAELFPVTGGRSEWGLVALKQIEVARARCKRIICAAQRKLCMMMNWATMSAFSPEGVRYNEDNEQ